MDPPIYAFVFIKIFRPNVQVPLYSYVWLAVLFPGLRRIRVFVVVFLPFILSVIIGICLIVWLRQTQTISSYTSKVNLPTMLPRS